MFVEMQNQPTQKSMIGKRSNVRGIAGILGDTLLQFSGLNPIYGPNLAAQREAMLKQQQLDEQRAYDEKQWMEREQWKRNNPAPSQFETLLGKAGFDQQRSQAILQDYVISQSNRPIAVRVANPDGSESLEFITPPRNGPPIGVPIPDPRKGGPVPQAPGGFSGFGR